MDEEGFKKGEKAFGTIRRGFEKAETELAKFGLALQGLREIYEGTIGKARELLHGVAENALQLERTSQITGLTTDALQGLDYAARKTGLSAEELQMGLVHLARSANEARMGGAGAAYAYQQLGIHVASPTGKLRPLNDLFFEVAQKLSRMPDGAQKAALSMELLGKSGAQLLPLLNKGPAGIAQFTEEAKKLGYVMGETALKSALAYENALGMSNAAVQGLKNAIAVQLLPAMTAATQRFTAWLAANRQWIALRVAQAFQVVSQVLHGFVRIGKGVIDILERIWKSGRAGKGVLIGLAVATALLTAPWLSLIAVLALVANSIERYMEGKTSFFGRIVYAFERLGKKLKETEWGHFLVDIFTDGLTAAKAFFDYVEGKLSGEQILSKTFGSPPRPGPGQSVFAPQPPATFGEGLGNLLKHFETGPNYNAGWQAPMLPMPEGLASLIAPTITFSPVIYVTASPGTNGKKVGKEIGDALVTHADLDRMLREAGAHLSNK